MCGDERSQELHPVNQGSSSVVHREYLVWEQLAGAVQVFRFDSALFS